MSARAGPLAGDGVCHPKRDDHGGGRGEDGPHGREIERLGHTARTLRALGTTLGRGQPWVVLALCFVFASVARAAEPVSYEVDAQANAATGRVAGTLTVEVRVSTDESAVRLWVYGDRLAVAPSALNELSQHFTYPGDVDLGEATVRDVRVDGAPVAIAWDREPVGALRGRDFAGGDVLVPVTPGAARTVRITLAFELRVPSRFGRFARLEHGRLSLEGPWYPLVVGERDAYAFRVPHHVTLRVEGEGEALLGDTRVGRGGTVTRTEAYVGALVVPRFHVFERDLEGLHVVFVLGTPPYEVPEAGAVAERGLADLLAVDLLGLASEVLRGVVLTARAARLALPETLTIVQFPSRTELTATAPGIVLVSERLYEVFPISETRSFHDHALARAAFRALLAERTASVEPPEDAAWAADARAALFNDLDDARRAGHAHTVEELVGFAGFHPLVDQLLYAPQIPFDDFFFSSIDEPDRFRDDPARARTGDSRGRRMIESARDVLGDEAFRAFAAGLVRCEAPFRRLLAEASPGMEARVEQWLDMPRLHVNYRLGAIRSAQNADGTWRHEVEVYRDGDVRLEPVDVAVWDASGAVVHGTWDGQGDHAVVVVETRAPRGDVMIDPRGRLPQDGAVARGHPRMDDTTSLPFRPPILQQFTVDVAAREGRIDGVLDVAVRRRYDIDNSFSLRLTSAAASIGGIARYTLGVGPRLDNNRRNSGVSFGLGFDRLREGFATDSMSGGWQGAVFASFLYDDRWLRWDARSGFSLAASAELTGVLRDQPGPTGAFTGTFAASVRSGVLLPIGLQNVVALVGGGGITLGIPLPGELQSLGGRTLLRGYQTSELLGAGRVFAVVEHRFTVIQDLSFNFFHLAWIRELQLAWFTGAGVLFDELITGATRFVADVGVGARVHFTYGGVQPGVLTVDFAIPYERIGEIPNRCSAGSRQGLFGSCVPVTFWIAFEQYF